MSCLLSGKIDTIYPKEGITTNGPEKDRSLFERASQSQRTYTGTTFGTVLQAVDYTNTEAERYNKRVCICNAIAMLLVVVYTFFGNQGEGYEK